MQVAYSNCPEIQEKNNIQLIPKRLARNHKNIMQIQRCRNNRRTYDARTCASFVEYTIQNEHSEFYGILER